MVASKEFKIRLGGGGGYWACMHLIWNLQAIAHREAWGEVLVYSTGEDELIVSQNELGKEEESKYWCCSL